MSELHPIEAAWRLFRNGEAMPVFRKCLHRSEALVTQLGLAQLPVEVVLPGFVPFNLVPLLKGRSPFDQRDAKAAMGNELMANTIQVWAAYREVKTIYRVEPCLASCLAQTPWPEAAPAEVLRLPSRCTMLEVPAPDQTLLYYAAVYDLATADERSGHLELRLSVLVLPADPITDSSGAPVREFNNRWMPLCVLRLSEGNLGSCLDAAARVAQKYGASADATSGWRNPGSGALINTLLYLAGEPDVVRLIHPGEKPTLKESIRRREPERYKDLEEPAVQAVGRDFTRAIERWEIEHPRDSDDLKGYTVRPHMRRAHAHLYWTGEGRALPRVRFLLPISVKGGKLVEEPETPRVTQVR